VALARAIAVRPKVLLLDEPLTALDALLRERLRVDIDQLLRSLGITTVYVTHDQAEAMSLGDRIVVMDRGRAAQIGTPQEIYFQPREAFVADFIGTINRISGVVKNGEFSAPGGSMKWDTNQTGPLDLIFRPENTAITDESSGAFSGTVATSFFLGDRMRIIIDGIGEEQLTLETDNRVQLRKGDPVSIAIDPEALVSIQQ
jgi:putative spermidine/putrescine transport system ATP-binding protein